MVSTLVNPVGVGLLLSDAWVSFQEEGDWRVYEISEILFWGIRARTFCMLKLLLFIPALNWRYFHDIYQFPFPITLILSIVKDI